jgi:hypothetical protein
VTIAERRRESATWLTLAVAATLAAAIPRLAGLALPTGSPASDLWWSLPRLLLVVPALAVGLGVAPLRLTGVVRGAPAVALGLGTAPLVWAAIAAATLTSGHDFAVAGRVALLLAAVLCFLVARRSRAQAPSEEETAPDASAMRLAWLAALVVALFFLAKPTLAYRSDAWFHAATAYRMDKIGLPPDDPFNAGIPLGYFWAFHLALGLLGGAAGVTPFAAGAAISVLAACGAALWLGLLAKRLCGPAAVAPALVLAVLGLDPPGWLAWLAQGLTGSEKGPAVLARAWQHGAGGSMAAITILYPHSSQSFFLDKFLLVTGLSLGYVATLGFAWALLEAGRVRDRIVLLIAALACASALFLHSVVGAAVVIAGLGAVALAALLPRGLRLATRPALAVTMGTLLAAAIAYPYIKLCTVAKTDAPAHLAFHLDMAWAWIAAGGFLLALAAREAWAWRQEGGSAGGERARFLLYFAGFVALSLFVSLVNRNESKFFNLAALLVAVPAAGGWVRLRGTLAGRLAWAVLLLGCVPTFLLGLSGFVAPDNVGVAGQVQPPPADRDIYAWIDRYTSPRAALLALPATADGELSRDPMVHARRALVWSGPEHGMNWGYAAPELASRADVVQALAKGTWSPREAETLDRLQSRAIPEIDYLAPLAQRAPAPFEEVARNAMWVVYRWPSARRLASVTR